jgi:hypothetical protein
METHTVVIDWGDGSAPTTLQLAAGVLTFSASHPYLDNRSGDAPFTIQVTITDQEGASTSGDTSVVVKNVAPTASAGPDQTVNQGSPVTLSGSFTDPGTLDTHTYSWVATSSDGQTVATGNGPTFAFTPSKAGTYSVTLTVTDNDGGVGTSTATVTVLPAPVSISGTVFIDTNSDGVQDAGEAGKAGVTVYLDQNGNGQLDAGEPTSVTDANGNYSFTNLPSGSYTIRLVLPATNLVLTGPSGSVRTINTTDPVTGMDFGLLSENVAFPINPVADLYGPHPNEDANTAFVKGLYHTMLGRDGDAGGIAYWANALANGLSREDAAWGFVNSSEHRHQQVDAYYKTFLGRTATDSASQYWVDLLQATGDEATVIKGILTSAEYAATHVSDESFVGDLYTSLLGRTADAGGAAYWEQQLAAGAGRAAVVDGVLHSRESATLAVDSYYAAFLHRTGDPLEEVWVSQLIGGTITYGRVAQGFLAAPEFSQAAGQHVP